MLLLVIGFAGLLVVLVAVVVDVSAVVLAKRAVASAADGAAITAAQALDDDAVYAGRLSSQLPLDPVLASSRVARYQTQVAASQPGLRLTVRVDGRTAAVRASRTLRLPLRVPGGSGSIEVTAEASARAPTLP